MDNELKSLRKSKGLSQTETAEILGRNRSLYARWERLDKVPQWVIDIVAAIPCSPSDPVALGKKLETLRNYKHITLEAVAAKVGMTRSGSRKYEQGKIKKFSKEFLEGAAEVLGVTVDDLVPPPP